MCHGLYAATAVDLYLAEARGIGVADADIACRGLLANHLHLAIALLAVCRHGKGFPVLGIVRDLQNALAAFIQPVQAHLLDRGHGAEVDIRPVGLASLPHAGEALCREDGANGLALAHEGNLLDGPVEGIVLAEGQLNGIEFALSLQFEGLLQFACHGGSLLGLLVGVVDNLPSAWAARQGVAL